MTFQGQLLIIDSCVRNISVILSVSTIKLTVSALFICSFEQIHQLVAENSNKNVFKVREKVKDFIKISKG